MSLYERIFLGKVLLAFSYVNEIEMYRKAGYKDCPKVNVLQGRVV